MAEKIQMPSVPEQDFAYRKTSSVKESMIRAGSGGKSRIIAGFGAAYKQRVSSMYGDSEASTMVSNFLRLLGGKTTPEWIDRFFARDIDAEIEAQEAKEGVKKKLTAKDKEQYKKETYKYWKKRKTKLGPWKKYWDSVWAQYQEDLKGSETSADGESADPDVVVVKAVTGNLVALEKKVDLIGNILQMTAEDVTDIKSLLMPKGVVAQGKSGEEFVQFNPLAPPGEQFNKITESGKLTAQKPSAMAQKSAEKKASLATAELALKIIEKDREKVELRKKFQFKEEEEKYKTEDPNAEFREEVMEKVDHIGEALDELKKDSLFAMIGHAIGGLFTRITDWFTGTFPLLSAIGKWSLVGFAGWLGYQVGTWIWDKFGTKVLDAVFWVKDKLMNFSSIIADITAKIRAVGEKLGVLKSDAEYKEEERKNAAAGRTRGGIASSKGMSMDESIVHYEKLSKDPKLTEQQREANARVAANMKAQRTPIVAQRTAKLSGKVAPPIPAPIMPTTETVSAIERDSDSWDTNYASVPASPPSITAVANTGTLTTKKGSETYEQRVKALGDIIASGESKGNYNVYNMGKGHGYKVRKDENLSKMTVGEFLRRGNLPSKDPQKMFATGKYQIIPATMADAVERLGLSKNLTLNPETQEYIFREYLTKSRRPKIHEYLTGKSDDFDGAVVQMAQEWASVGVPRAMQGANRWVQAGESYYAGDGINKAHTPPEKISAVIRSMDSSTAEPTKPEVRVASLPLPPTPVIQGAVIDSQSRQKEATMSSAATVAMIAPTNVVNNTNVSQTVGKRPAAKADVLAQDKSLVRTISKDSHHPVYG